MSPMEICKLSKKELLEQRRRDRESWREFLRCQNWNVLWRIFYVCEYFLICWFDSVRYAVRETLYSLAQNLLIPKFCNGLIGCNRTDSIVPAR